MKKVSSFLVIIILFAFFSNVFATGGWIDKGGYLEQSYQIGAITFIKYSRDGKYIFTFGKDNIFRKWDLETGNIIKETKIDEEPISTFDVNSDGSQYAYSKPKSGLVYMHDYKTDSTYIFNSFAGYKTLYDYFFSYNARTVLFHPALPQLFILPLVQYDIPEDFTARKIDDGIITVFSTELYQWLYSKQTGSFKSLMTFSPDGALAAYCTYQSRSESYHNSTISQYEIKSTILTNKSFTIHHTIDTNYCSYITGLDFTKNLLTFSANSKLLAYLDNDSIYVLNTSTLKKIDSWYCPDRGVYHLNDFCFTNDGNNLITASNHDSLSKIDFWSISTGNLIQSFKFDSSANSWKLINNKDGSFITTGSSDGIIRIIYNYNPDTIKASFFASNTLAYTHDSIYFRDMSKGKMLIWSWDFGDGFTSTEQNPYHSYQSTGNYTVTLIIKNWIGKSDTLLMKDYIHVIKEPDGIADYIKNNSSVSLCSYPNPARDKIAIKYTVPSDEFVKLTLYNIFGEEAAVLVNELKSAGEYTAEFNTSLLPAGTYYYRLKRGENIQLGRVTIIK